MNYYYDITGIIKLIKPEGYGFIIPDKPLASSEEALLDARLSKDIFFHHASFVDRDTDWGNLKVGQKVHIATVIVNAKGLHGEEISFISPNSKARSARKDR
jgi:cold shock CspA family protein